MPNGADTQNDEDDEYWYKQQRRHNAIGYIFNDNNDDNDDNDDICNSNGHLTKNITGDLDDDLYWLKGSNVKKNLFDDDAMNRNEDFKAKSVRSHMVTTPFQSSSSPKAPVRSIKDIVKPRTDSLQGQDTHDNVTKVITSGVASNSRDRSNLTRELILKAEISSKTADIQFLLEKREQAPDIPETIDRIIKNKPFWFDLYKSKGEKIRLLDEAINSGDGNAILAVVLFIKRTLLPDLFLNIILTKQEAFNHYIYYLEQINDFNQLTDIYRRQGKLAEAAANTYRPILQIDDESLNEKLKFLNDFKDEFTNTEMANIASKYIRLLEFQRKIEKLTIGKICFSDLYGSKRVNNKSFLQSNALNTNSVLDTLYYCLKNYIYLPKQDNEFSIDKLKTIFELNNKQYTCVFIKAMADIYAWSEIERFMCQRGVFIMKRSPDIPWETVASIIYQAKGPIDEVKRYIRHITDLQIREAFAMKYKLHDVVIECYKQSRNRQAIIQYRTRFAPGSTEHILCDIALKDDSIKWKN